MASEKKYDFSLFIQTWAPMTFSVVVTVVGVTLWFQKYGEEHYYPQISGDHLEQEVRDLKDDMDKIRAQNDNILVALGRIEGKLE